MLPTTLTPARGGAVLALIATSLVAAAVKIAGAVLDVGWTSSAQWLYLPPLTVVLVLAGGLRDRRGWWWLVGLALSWVGDAFGGADFLLLLGSFLVAHVCFIVALWPTRAAGAWGRLGSVPYLLLALAGTAAIVPAAGGLTVPVVLYAAALTVMAILATAAGRAGALGGLLFLVSDLTLGLCTFVLEWPTAVRTAVVIGTYVPAQVLLLVAFLRLLASTRSGSPRAANRWA